MLYIKNFSEIVAFFQRSNHLSNISILFSKNKMRFIDSRVTTDNPTQFLPRYFESHPGDSGTHNYHRNRKHRRSVSRVCVRRNIALNGKGPKSFYDRGKTTMQQWDLLATVMQRHRKHSKHESHRIILSHYRLKVKDRMNSTSVAHV